MAKEEKSQKVVESYKAVAAGLASVLAAVFTSSLGVAGTLIGTAVTAVLITLGSALFKVQLMKATDKISPRAPGSISQTAGYFMVSLEPRLPSTHSMVAPSWAIARLVTRL